MIGGPEESQIGRERNQAFRTLVHQYGLDPDPVLVRTGSFTVEDGYRRTKELFEANLGIDGVVVASNLLGIGVLKAFRDLKVSTPDEVDLAVFDEVGDFVDPPVTHVRQPAQEIGAQATRFLLERMQGFKGAARMVLFEPHLLAFPASSLIR